MPYKPIEVPAWMKVLDKESQPRFESLMHVHDTLINSEDSSMRLSAAWAALYASQKEDDRADDAYAIAVAEMEAVAQAPNVSRYEWSGRETPLKAHFNRVLAPVVRKPKMIYGTDERREFYKGLALPLSACLEKAEAGSADGIGLLSEVVVASLCWRPNPVVLSRFNVVPAGPIKDGRLGYMQFNTDLYAYHPEITTNAKSRINLQVKTQDRLSRRVAYDEKVMVLIGLNTAIFYDSRELIAPEREMTLEEYFDTDAPERYSLKGREAAALAARILLRDMADQPLDDYEEEVLLYSYGSIFSDIVQKIDEKTDLINDRLGPNARKRFIEKPLFPPTIFEDSTATELIADPDTHERTDRSQEQRPEA